MSESKSTVGILGAGTMGAGIAQVAAAAGWTVELKDVEESTVFGAIEGIKKRFARNVEKGRMSAADADAAGDRLLLASCNNCLRPCDLIIEAIVEDMDVKVKVLSDMIPALREDAIIASNTSSLSITALGERLGVAGRTVGMHFFNPAPLMKLVEVIAGDATDDGVVERVMTIGQDWGKQVAKAADVPGFIVNHVARPYYLEAFRVLQDGVATATQVDDIMRRLGGFRMGPLELTDLIGQDVNTATTRSVWDALDQPPLLAPSSLQESLVKRGDLGRKSGRGVYDHSTKPPSESISVDVGGFEPGDELADAVRSFATALTDASDDLREQYVFSRIVVAIMTQAALAHERGVATEADINTAMKFGVNYPQGPFEWGERVGIDRWIGLLAALHDASLDDRFAVPASLRSKVH